MFISKKQYRRLIAEMGEMRGNLACLALELSRLRNDEVNVLFGFASDIERLQEKTADFKELAEAERLELEQERKAAEGLRNIWKY